MNLKEIRVDTFSNASTKIDMRLTHTQSGVSVEGSGHIVNSLNLRTALLADLEKKIEASDVNKG